MQSENQKYFCELNRTRYPKLRNLALLYLWEDARVFWANWNHSFHMHLSHPGTSILCFFPHPEFLSAHHKEWLQPGGCQIAQLFFSFLRTLEGWNCWQLWLPSHSCILAWEIPWTEADYSPWVHKWVRHNLKSLILFHQGSDRLKNTVTD